ncbi:hypothetical protein [Legionella sp. CNM-4043-24]|uniref:hypothetical protein n=1 Tax=Legionella sp. CNM-4043-24 TaxID=3421646 RepID=UPI00403AD121
MPATAYYYWEDILDLNPDVEARCAKTLDQIRNGQFKSACLKKLKGHNLWSARAGYKERLLFTVIAVAGREYLCFVELSNEHYDDSFIMKNKKALKRFRTSRKGELLQAATWEDADGAGLGNVNHSKGARRAAPLRWFNHHMIELSDEQRNLQSIRVPALISGLAGSGKTSTVLLTLPKLRLIYNEIVCIANTAGLRNDMQRAWNGLPQAMEPGNPVVFLTWLEWAERNGLSLAGKTLVGEQEFKAWYRKQARKIARYHSVEVPFLLDEKKIDNKEQRALHADAEASAIYQELRIACGYDSLAYQALGTRFSLFPQQSAERHFVHELIMPAWEKHCVQSAFIDPSIVALAPEPLDGLLWIEEAQDFSCRQIRDLLRHAGKKLQFIACAGEYQRLNDSLPFIDHLQKMVFEAGTSLSRAVLPGSFRVPTVLEGTVQLLMDWSVRDAGGVQDRDQVRTFKSTLSPHAVPGSAHWFDREEMSSETFGALRAFGANNPEFAVLTCEDYVEEARSVFGDDVLIFTIEAIKGMEFKNGVHYRLLDTLPCERISRLHETEHDTGAGSSNHRPKNRIGNWRNATTYHRLFTAYTRFSERLVVIENSTGNYNTVTLSNALRSTLPSSEPLTLSDAPVDASPRAWAKRVRQFIRRGNHDTALRLFVEKCHGNPEDFAGLVRRLERRVEPVMPQEPVAAPSCSSSSPVSYAPSTSASSSSASSSTMAEPVRRRTKGRRQGAKSVKADAKSMLARLFNPDDSSLAALFTQAPELTLEAEHVLKILTTPINLIPLITLEQFGMQFRKTPHAERSSMMYWVFKNASQGRNRLLNALLEQNPSLIHALGDYCRQLYRTKDICFDDRYADLRHLTLLQKQGGSVGVLLDRISKYAGLPADRHSVFGLIILHIPMVYQKLCISLHMQPLSRWEEHIRLYAPEARSSIGVMIDDMRNRIENSRIRWRKSCRTDNLMQSIRTYFQVGVLNNMYEKIAKNPLATLRDKASHCQEPSVMLDAINYELQNCGKNWFHPVYSVLYAAREGIMEAMPQATLPVSGPRAASSSSSGFFQPAPSARSGIHSAEELYQKLSCLKLMELFVKDESAVARGGTSFFDWLCEPRYPERLEALRAILCGENQELITLFAIVLTKQVLAGHFHPAVLDVQRLAMIVDTAEGAGIIEFYAKILDVSPAELLQAIASYYPPECQPWADLLHQIPEGLWERFVTPVVSRHPRFAEYAHVYERLKGIYSQANRRGRGLIESRTYSLSQRDNTLLALELINGPESKKTPDEKAIIDMLTQQIVAEGDISDEALNGYLVRAREIPKLPRAGMLAGYLRAVTDPVILSRLSDNTPAQPDAATCRLG